MSVAPKDRPEYAWLREFKQLHESQLRSTYGAHGTGIGRKKVNGNKTDDLALIFYVARKRPVDSCAAQAIPKSISFTPAGMAKTVELITDVVESEPAELE